MAKESAALLPPPAHVGVHLEGNLLEMPAVLIPRIPGKNRKHRWLVLDVLAVVCSMSKLHPDWEVQTSLRGIARFLGQSMGGLKLRKIREALEYLAQTELEFPSFLRKGRGGASSKGPARFRVFKQMDISTPKGDRSRPVTVRIRWADEIMENLQGRYLKTVRLFDYLTVRQAANQHCRLALPLWLYLAKKNKPVWKEGAQLLHQRLDLVHFRPARARQMIGKAAETLKFLGRISDFEHRAKVDQYVFTV